MGGKEPGAAPGEAQLVAERLKSRDAGMKAHPPFGQGERLQNVRHGSAHAVVKGVTEASTATRCPCRARVTASMASSSGCRVMVWST